MDLAWLLRDNNGALQVSLRLDGLDHFINRFGRFDDPIAQAEGRFIPTGKAKQVRINECFRIIREQKELSAK